MYLKLLLLVLALMPLNAALHAGVWDSVVNTFSGTTKPKPPSIRVLIVHDVPKATLDIRGQYSLYDPKTEQFIDMRFTGKKREIVGLDDGLKWGEAFPGRYQLEFRPTGTKTAIFLDGKEYKGSLFVYDIGKTISIVNQLSIEDYVKAILADYNNYHLQPEALAALAIAARTNAYYQNDNPKTKFWTVDAQKVGFRGAEPLSPEINEAVRVTRHMILSQTGVYERRATPIPSQFNTKDKPASKNAVLSKISLEEVNKMAQDGDHAAKILGKAFPGTTIMLLEYSN